MNSFEIRPIQPIDSNALTNLRTSAADTGDITVAFPYRIDPYTALTYLGDRSQTIVAVQPSGKLIGAATVTFFDDVQFDGAMQPTAYLSNLIVHPEHRRQGVGRALARRRIALAHERFGQGCLITAMIQSGNAGSFRVAKSWSGSAVGSLETTILKTRSKPPRKRAQYRVREARSDELDAFAAQSNRFYRSHHFYTPQSAETLTAWLQTSPLPTPFHSIHIVEDRTGHLLAGIAVSETFRVREMAILNLSTPLKMLNKLLRVVPESGVMKQLDITHVWCLSGKQAAATYLLRAIQHQWHQKADVIACAYDPTGTVREIISEPRWIPKGKVTLVASQLPSEQSRTFPLA